MIKAGSMDKLGTDLHDKVPPLMMKLQWLA